MVQILLLTALIFGQITKDPLLSRLEGRWEGAGTVLGQDARLEMTWEWILDKQFLQLTFRNDMTGPSGTRRFEARAFYRPDADGGYQGVWVDNTGVIRPIKAIREDTVLVATWGTLTTEIGETTYKLLEDGRLEVTDRIHQRDGTWRPFGRAVFSRR